MYIKILFKIALKLALSFLIVLKKIITELKQEKFYNILLKL